MVGNRKTNLSQMRGSGGEGRAGKEDAADRLALFFRIRTLLQMGMWEVQGQHSYICGVSDIEVIKHVCRVNASHFRPQFYAVRVPATFMPLT